MKMRQRRVKELHSWLKPIVNSKYSIRNTHMTERFFKAHASPKHKMQ